MISNTKTKRNSLNKSLNSVVEAVVKSINNMDKNIKNFIAHLNKSSIITAREQSDIIDFLFDCGEDVETEKQWFNPETKQAETIKVTYKDATLEEQVKRQMQVFDNTPYLDLGKAKFLEDFALWCVRGYDIQRLKCDFICIAPYEKTDEYIKVSKERAALWEKLQPVFLNVVQGVTEQQINRADESTLKDIEPLNNDKKELPSELNTDEAKRIFKKLEVLKNYEKNGNLYKWIGTGASFGAFVDLLSRHLNVRPGNDRLPWHLFVLAFDVDEKKERAAKKAVNNYRNNRSNEPDIYQDIKHLLK